MSRMLLILALVVAGSLPASAAFTFTIYSATKEFSISGSDTGFLGELIDDETLEPTGVHVVSWTSGSGESVALPDVGSAFTTSAGTLLTAGVRAFGTTVDDFAIELYVVVLGEVEVPLEAELIADDSFRFSYASLSLELQTILENQAAASTTLPLFFGTDFEPVTMATGVPEPSSIGLLGLGALALGISARRRRA